MNIFQLFFSFPLIAFINFHDPGAKLPEGVSHGIEVNGGAFATPR